MSYLNRDNEVEKYIHRFADDQGFYHQIQEKSSQFGSMRRNLLADRLLYQNKILEGSHHYEHAYKNIELLRASNTFSVTTGHQLCLFSGPMYFIYKILSTIKLAEKLKSDFPDKNFVPILWLASEDHDWEEVNHFYFQGKKWVWNKKETAGAVGRQSTDGLAELLQKFREDIFPKNQAALEWIDLLEQSYLKSENLSEAVRKLCHKLFGKYGLVILDADDKELKKVFSPLMERELYERNTYNKVNQLSEDLGRMWFKQVNPREINLFYLIENLRERIEWDGQEFKILNTDMSFSADEMREEIHNHPERFSPNVVTRPVYQEYILPNLAYIGGAGELAYWMQYKGAFENYGMHMPLLILRNSVLLLPEKQYKKWTKKGFSKEEIFTEDALLWKKWIKENRPIDPEMSAAAAKLKEIFDEIDQIAALTDASMQGAARAQRAKQIKGLENLKKKLLKAEKRKHAELKQLIGQIQNKIYPEGVLQERYENLSEYYVHYGSEFISYLYKTLKSPSRKASLVLY